ncbi:MAG: endonuclease/exonuclease/phosphatase family protein [Pseudomonadota bacterium]
MIGRVEAWLRRLRRLASRSEWLARLLRLPRDETAAGLPGLVLMQIDGLGKSELERALARGEMPFLRRLLRREHYRLHPLYAGVPATTAAFQAELFYGVQGAVPGFSFMERASGRLVRMLEPAAAARVERALEEGGAEPLLREGSGYVNAYRGGAAEAHFTPAAAGWGPALRAANPLVVMLFVLGNALSFLRMLALIALELALAFVDLVRGLIEGQDFLRELLFVPTRVAVSILLRELAVIGAKIDVARGLPVVHLNFLGYDEQAHRRGPASLFAHWTLKGIDDAIARVWRAAHRSERRHYDVWIHSDHGQETTCPYEKRHGRSFAEAAAEAVARSTGRPVAWRASGRNGVQLQRASLLGGRRVQRLFTHPPSTDDAGDNGLAVAALGPVAMLYLDPPAADPAALARALLEGAGAPLVLAREGSDRARAWTREGAYTLPADAARLLGEDHPFLDAAARDLAALTRQPDAGDLVVCGWRAGAEALSFALENGAHGGAAPHETAAFALLPGDIALDPAAGEPARALDLRRAALRLLGRAAARRPARREAGATLRVMTYNVHSCIGMDGKLSPERIARVIARAAPDIVALQELDAGRPRTGEVDQAHRIAHCLEMDFHFHPALHVEEERYGDAILSHLPMRLVRAGALPGLPGLEPRGALWVAVECEGREVQVINTHLGLVPRERLRQVEALLGPEWLAHPDCRGPAILLGDLNAGPSSPVCRRLAGRLQDAQAALPGRRPRATFFGRLPLARIDHVFVGPGIEVADIEVPDSELVRLASDHLPLLAELRLDGAGTT